MFPHGSISNRMIEERCQRASTTACCLAASPLKSTTGGAVGFTAPIQAYETIMYATSCRTGNADINADHRRVWFSLDGNSLIVGKGQPPDLIPFVERDAPVDLPAVAGFRVGELFFVVVSELDRDQ